MGKELLYALFRRDPRTGEFVRVREGALPFKQAREHYKNELASTEDTYALRKAVPIINDRNTA